MFTEETDDIFATKLIYTNEIKSLINGLIEEIAENPKLRLHLVTSGLQIYFDE